MSKEALKLKMDTLRDIALKIEEKENASKRLFSEAHGFFKAYSMVQTFCENYKKNELSNDKLDEKGIDIEQHTKIVNAIDEISKYCELEEKKHKESISVYRGQMIAFSNSITDLDKMNEQCKQKLDYKEKLEKELEQEVNQIVDEAEESGRRMGQRPVSLKESRNKEETKKKRGRKKSG